MSSDSDADSPPIPSDLFCTQNVESFLKVDDTDQHIIKKNKLLVNESERCFEEYIEAILIHRPKSIKLIQNSRVLIQHPIPTNRVNIVVPTFFDSYPSFTGFIADGMISCVAMGTLMTYPTLESVLIAIRAVTMKNSPKNSCLLIVRNSCVNRLTCAMACEQATLEDRTVNHVNVADDCAIPSGKYVDKNRGEAGTIFVAKIAGAAAIKGMSLEEVTNVARMAAQKLCSLAAAFDVPCKNGEGGAKKTGWASLVKKLGHNDRSDRIISIGVGTRGELGIWSTSAFSADFVAKQLLFTIHDYGDVSQKLERKKLAILVNNLSGFSSFGLMVFAKSVVNILESEPLNCQVCRLYFGSYMTGFGVNGASVTILSLDDEGVLLDLLDHPTSAPEWKQVDNWDPVMQRPSFSMYPQVAKEITPLVTEPCKVSGIGDFNKIAKNYLTNSCNAIILCKDFLNKWGQSDDTTTPGKDNLKDIGYRLSLIAKAVLDRKMPTSHPIQLFLELKNQVEVNSDGNFYFNNILALFFSIFATSLIKIKKQEPMLDADSFRNAFSATVQKLLDYTLEQKGHKNIMDALVPAAKAATKTGSFGMKLSLWDITQAAKLGTQKAIDSKPDPGAMLVCIVLESMAKENAHASVQYCETVDTYGDNANSFGLKFGNLRRNMLGFEDNKDAI